MQQLHRRFTNEQVKVLFRGYCQGVLTRAEIQEMLGIGKSRFFVLLKEYRRDAEDFSIAYGRHSPGKLSAALAACRREDFSPNTIGGKIAVIEHV